MHRRRTARPVRRPVVALAGAALVAGTLAGTGGCASSRWVDAHTPGDLWGTAGTELGAVKLLGDAPAERREARGNAAKGDGGGEAVLDLLIELVLQGLSTW